MKMKLVLNNNLENMNRERCEKFEHKKTIMGRCDYSPGDYFIKTPQRRRNFSGWYIRELISAFLK